MKNVRVIYKKEGSARFISHLDLMRLFTRIVRKANIPIWYTEGFNPHAYFNFALPLSLGVTSEYEIVDMRITSDSLPCEDIANALQDSVPQGFNILKVYVPENDYKLISAADYKIEFFNNSPEFFNELNNFFAQTNIICKKKNKKKQIIEFNAGEKIIKKQISMESYPIVYLTLPAGNSENVNPQILVNAFLEHIGNQNVNYLITRTAILNNHLKLFK